MSFQRLREARVVVGAAGLPGTGVTTAEITDINAKIARTYPATVGTDGQVLGKAAGVPAWVAGGNAVIDARDFSGMDPTGTTDSTAAFNQMMAQSWNGIDPMMKGGFAEVAIPCYIPLGTYILNNAQWNGKTKVIGDGAGFTRLVYGGVGGAGTTLLRNAKPDGAVAFAGFDGMSMIGWTGESEGIAEHLLLNEGGVGIDWGFILEDIAMGVCGGDALVLTNTPGAFINAFIRRIRWDYVNGYGIRITGTSLSVNRAFELSHWTWDNDQDANTKAKMAAQGFSDGVAGGKGLLHLDNADGVEAVIRPGSIEVNIPLRQVAGQRSVFYINHSVAWSSATLVLDGVRGYGYAPQRVDLVGEGGDRVATVILTGGTHVNEMGMGFRSTNELDSISSAEGPHVQSSRHANPGGAHPAMMASGMRMEVRGGIPASSQYYPTRTGDRIIRPDIVTGQNTEWLCVGPNPGWSFTNGFAISTSVNTTSASTTISVLDTDLPGFRGLIPGANIAIAAAGAAGATLNARVTAVGASSGGRTNLTISVAASSTGTLRTASWQTPTWVASGIAGGVQASAQANSSATTIAGLVTDFNALLAKLRAANLIGT